MKYILILLTFFFFNTLTAQTKYSKVKINLRNKSIQDLVKSNVEIDHGIYKEGKYFIGEFSSEELQKINSAGYEYKVMIDDLQANILKSKSELKVRGNNGCVEETKKDYKVPDNFHLGTMAGNLTYSEMLEDLDSMSKKYPNLISKRQVIDTFLTEEGRPLYWFRISDNPETKEDEPEILYTALHHAREPVSMMQMIFYMWYLLENYDKDPMITYLIDNRELYFIPCINPDGYSFNEQTNPNGGGNWRKNRSDSGNGDFGVDLNRNYGYEWGFNDLGSSPNTNNITYRGTEGFSEAETKAVKYFCESHDFILALNFHTYGNLLIHPWGYEPIETEDSTAFIKIGNLLSSENNYNSGLAFQTVGYNANGDSDDWMYGDTINKKKILAFTPEVGTLGFWPDVSEIIPQCKDNILLNLRAASIADAYTDVKEISPDIFSNKSSKLLYEITNYGLENGDVTLLINSLNKDILDLQYSKNIKLKSFESSTFEIPFTLADNTKDYTSFLLEITIDNGLYETKDTIKKTFAKINEILISDCNNIDKWNITSGEWNTTNKEYVSSDYSITDSPDENYKPNNKNELLLNSKIFVPNSSKSILNFKAKWDIEKGYDWAAVFASSDGINFIPLCGDKTVLGTKDQLENEPIFDGSQVDWIDVNINLDQFANDSIYLKFIMNSDPFVNGDGFYFDDLKILSLGLNNTNKTFENSIYKINVLPNPANDFIEFENLKVGDKIIVENEFGQVISQKNVTEISIKIPTSKWNTGIYFYHIIRGDNKSATKKFIIVH